MTTTAISPTAVSPKKPRQRRGTELMLLLFAYVISLAAFAQVDLVLLDELSSDFTTFAAIFGIGLAAAHVSLRWLAPYADPILLPVVSLLNGLGLSDDPSTRSCRRPHADTTPTMSRSSGGSCSRSVCSSASCS